MKCSHCLPLHPPDTHTCCQRNSLVVGSDSWEWGWRTRPRFEGIEGWGEGGRCRTVISVVNKWTKSWLLETKEAREEGTDDDGRRTTQVNNIGPFHPKVCVDTFDRMISGTNGCGGIVALLKLCAECWLTWLRSERKKRVIQLTHNSNNNKPSLPANLKISERGTLSDFVPHSCSSNIPSINTRRLCTLKLGTMCVRESDCNGLGSS